MDAGGLEWTDWAMAPGDLAAIAETIERRGLRSAAELGSGVSTVVLARALAANGGRITSLEHDQEWARRVHDALGEEGLLGTARVVGASLEHHPLAAEGAVWYAEEGVAALPAEIDLLLVDGPPGNLQGMERGRYPALPVLADRLAAGAMVVLDDAGRDGERWILERWEQETGIAFTHREGGRIAVGSAA